MSKLALRTFFGTYLTYDRATRSLAHRFPCESYEPVDVESMDGQVWTFQQASMSDHIFLRHNASYARAEPSGVVSYVKENPRQWETFQLVPWAYVEAGVPARTPTFKFQRTIPRHIHQIFLAEDMPAAARNCITDLRIKNPDFTHTLWDAQQGEAFVESIFGRDMLLAYLSINPIYYAARADLLRYLIIYKFGGVYLDVKSGTTIPLNSMPIWASDYVLSQWDNGDGRRYRTMGMHADLAPVLKGGEFQQWFILASPGHPFLENVINRVLRNIWSYTPQHFDTGKLGVLKTTGPIPYTMAIAELVERYPAAVVQSEDIGFVFTAIQRHDEVFVDHYSKQKGPIIFK